MALTKGSPCSACKPVRHWSEFLKILDRGDVGITIYRYRGPAYDEMGRSDKKPKETFIFYTTSKVTERCGGMGLDIYTTEPRCLNYCPRCIEMKRKVEAMSRNAPTDRGADLCEIFSCPPCSDLVHKFRKFTARGDLIKEQDSELIHLQRLAAPCFEDALCTARTKFENLVKFEANDPELIKKDNDLETNTTKIPKLSEKGSKDATGMIKNKDRMKKKDKTEEIAKKSTGGEKPLGKANQDKDLKTKTTEPQKSLGKSSQDKDLKTKSTKAQKSLAKSDQDKDLKTKSTEAQKPLGKSSQDKDLKTKSTKAQKSLDKSGQDKDLKTNSTEAQKPLGKASQDKNLKTKSTKAQKSLAKSGQDKDLKTKSTEAQKPLGKASQDKDLKTKSTKTQKSLAKISQDKKTKSSDKIASTSKVGNIDGKNEKGGKTRKSTSETKIATKGKKSTAKLESHSAEKNPLIRIKISEHIRKKAKEEHAQRANALQLLKRRKDIDDKLNHANKMEDEARIARALAEKARQMKFKAAMQGAGGEKSESEDRQTDVCSDETVVNCMIRGNKICEVIKAEQAEKPVLAVTSMTTPLTLLPPPQAPPTPNTDSKTPGDSGTARDFRDGRLKYLLSERKYLEKGWTLLPKEMVMRKVTLFEMHPARNEFDWLEQNRHKERVLYDSGEQLATFDDNGCARVYYRSGVLALDFYQAEETNAGGYRVVVYSTGRPVDGRAQRHTVLAAFDYSGNGAVFDHAGRPRLKYTQNDGVVLDRNIGPYTHWKWHNLNDAGRLQTVLVENEPKNKDFKIMSLGSDQLVAPQPKRGREKSANKDRVSEKSVSLTIQASEKSDEPTTQDEMIMRTIESENVIKENCRLLKGFSPYQIKMKAFKINEHFSLRIINQASVFLTFTDGKTRFRTNVGMVMDPTVVLGQDLVEVGEVASSLERIPASKSLEELQRVVRGARASERARILREERFNPPVSNDTLSCFKDRSCTH